ncbi:MAG: LysR family transcriptional regulator [Gallionella sp.]|nr:LysR family transcriptional regulator [Gallionella sp.]
MASENLNDLLAFITVAREGSFTRAAAQLGVSQSALSHTMRGLEARVGLRLLNRSTRSVSPTQAGERLLRTIGPRLDEIGFELAALSELRDKPAGIVRITATEHSANTVLWPKLSKELLAYPDIRVEITTDSRYIDIVAERYDAGVRLGGEEVAKDMVAVRIAPDMRVAVVGSPGYFEKRPPPKTPHDLAEHNCINLRSLTSGGLYAWEFEKNGNELNVHVEGQWIFSSTAPMLEAALAGYGLAYIPEDVVAPYIAGKRLQRVLKDWSPIFPGYHLYYPARHPSPALDLVVKILRHKSGGKT